jgi:hypothetical protein
MRVTQHWKKTPNHKYNHSVISDDFSIFFEKHLPEFFKEGVSLRQIHKAMPNELFRKFCKEQNITWNNGYFFQEIKDIRDIGVDGYVSHEEILEDYEVSDHEIF